MSYKKEHTITPHSHCQVCGKAISEGKIYCSTKCEEEYTKKQSKYQKMTRIYYIIFIVIILIILITFLIGGGLRT
jgi:predicted nucleic acid-binding Zn ribbon protein